VIKGEINTREGTPAQACTNAINHDIWHMRLGHPSHKRITILNRKFPFISLPVNFDCDVCHLAKQRKLPFPNSTSYVDSVFDLVHMDIWGPCAVNSMNGDKYFLTIVDDHSRFTWLYLMKSKAKTRIHLINFVSMIKTQFQKTIKIIRTYNGLEFNMTNFFKTEGIIHQTSCIETPKQNGLVERKHQHIMNVTRALLFQFNL